MNTFSGRRCFPKKEILDEGLINSYKTREEYGEVLEVIQKNLLG